MSLFQNICFSFCVFSLVLLLWALNKGFDLSDEGYYLMCLKYPSEYLISNQWGNSVIGALTSWLNPGIITFRTLRLVLTGLSTTYLAYHLNLFIKEQFEDKGILSNFLIVFCFVLSGSALSYALYPATISYNSLTVILLQIIVGQFFFLVNSTEVNTSRDNLVCAGIGVALMLLTIAKFSSGLVMSFVVLFTINIRHVLLNNSYKDVARDAFFLVVGFSLTALIVSMLDVSVLSRFSLILEEMQYHNGGEMFEYINGYYTSTRNAIAEVRDLFWWVIVIFFCTGLLSRWDKHIAINWVQETVISFSFLYLFYRTIELQYFSKISEMINPYIIISLSVWALLFGTAIGKASFYRFSNHSRKLAKYLLVCTLLMGVPLIGTVGTNNLLTVQSVLYLFAITVMLFLNVKAYSVLSKNRISQYTILIVLLTLTGMHLFTGMVNHPYRQSQSLNTLTHILPNYHVKIDDRGYNYFTSIKKVLDDNVLLEDNHPMVDATTTPGLIYLLNGKSPGSVWNRSRLIPLYSKRILESKMEKLDKTILFIPTNGIDPLFVSTLNAKGINYPETYVSIGTIKHYLRGYSVSIFVPKQILK